MEDPAARVVAAVDAERRRLERCLHDGAQQQLVAVAVNLQLLDQLVGTDPPAAKALLGEIRNEVRDTLGELRLLAGRLYPPLSGMRGLAASLRAAAAGVGVPTRIDVSAAQKCPDEIAATVYLCCLQALEAVAADDAPGAHVTVDVRHQDGALVFEIAGFTSGEAAVGTLGLIEARVAAVGGRFAVASEPGPETRLTGTIPLG